MDWENKTKRKKKSLYRRMREENKMLKRMITQL